MEIVCDAQKDIGNTLEFWPMYHVVKQLVQRLDWQKLNTSFPKNQITPGAAQEGRKSFIGTRIPIVERQC
jgi:hypothetical protein